MEGSERIVIPYHPRPYQLEVHSRLDAHRFAVVVMHRRAGKTVMTLNHLIRRALTATRPNGLFAYVGPYREQARSIAWRYLKHFTGSIPGRKVNETMTSVYFPHNGATVRIFGADNPDALRGLRFDGVVMDEVADMRPGVWQEIVRPALADRRGWCVFIGTPKGLNLFHELFTYAATVEAERPDGDWCAVMRRVDETGALPDSEVEAMRSEMSESTFRQELLCDFNASAEDVLVPLDLVTAATARRPELSQYEFEPLVFGVDVARFGDDTTVVSMRRGTLLMPQVELRRADTMQVAGTVAHLAREHRPDMVFVDGVGIGAGVVDRLRDLGMSVMDVQAQAPAVQSARFTNRRAEMWSEMRDWIRDRGCLPPEAHALHAELTCTRFVYDSSGRLKMESKADIKHRGMRSPDHADSLALTFSMPVQGGAGARMLAAVAGRRKARTEFDLSRW